MFSEVDKIKMDQFLSVIENLEQYLNSISYYQKINLSNEEMDDLKFCILEPSEVLEAKAKMIIDYNNLLNLFEMNLSFIKNPKKSNYLLFLDYVKLKDVHNEYLYLLMEGKMLENMMNEPKSCKVSCKEYWYLSEDDIKKQIILKIIENSKRKEMIPRKLEVLNESLERMKNVENTVEEINLSRQKLEEILKVEYIYTPKVIVNP